MQKKKKLQLKKNWRTSGKKYLEKKSNTMKKLTESKTNANKSVYGMEPIV